MKRRHAPDGGLFFMKVGLHAGEDFEQILERKRREYQDAGVSFWGYGGGTCHPTRVVQPFAKLTIEHGDNIYLVMEEINSRHPPTHVVAKEYSEDGILWKPIPRGIEVRGSRYAVILGDIQDGELDIDLAHYEVGAGPSMGKPASQYVAGRVDKACITKAANPVSGLPSRVKNISHLAEIRSPFAVFLRSEEEI